MELKWELPFCINGVNSPSVEGERQFINEACALAFAASLKKEYGNALVIYLFDEAGEAFKLCLCW